MNYETPNFYVVTTDGILDAIPCANELEAVVEAFTYDGFKFEMVRNRNGDMIARASQGSRNSMGGVGEMFEVGISSSSLTDEEEAKLDLAKQLIKEFPFACHSAYDIEIITEADYLEQLGELEQPNPAEIGKAIDKAVDKAIEVFVLAKLFGGASL